MANLKKGIKKIGAKIKNGGKKFWHWYYDEDGWRYVLIGGACFNAGCLLAEHGIKKRLNNTYDNGFNDGKSASTAEILSGEHGGDVFQREDGSYYVVEYRPEVLSKEEVEKLGEELPNWRSTTGLSFNEISTRLYNE